MERVDEIFAGPWAKDAEPAEAWLRSLKGDAGKKDLKKVLKPHWEAVPSARADELRASFDAAFTALQLADLAIMTKYVRREDIETPARMAFDRLLSTASARRFVDDYDYVGVRYLAARLDIDLALVPVRPPEPVAAPTLFASFLAQFRDWYEDPELETWLEFLDDFVMKVGEAEQFNTYLRVGKRPKDEETAERFDELLAGLDVFLTNLYDIFAVIPIEKRPIFALVHIYWIAAFFGYELENGRYARNYINWQPAAAKTPLVTGARRALWNSSLETLQDVWREARALVEATRV